MNSLMPIFLFLFAGVFSFGNSNVPELSLNLKRALPVDGPKNIEPSGLTIFKNRLFTVSDDQDDTIFRIKLLQDKAILEPYIKFNPPKLRGVQKLDFEGITCDDDGNFYLLSESACRILRVPVSGRNATWVTPSLKSYGEEKGLLQQTNAGPEGIAFAGWDKFIICAEREHRGILAIDLGKRPIDVSVLQSEKTALKMPKDRPPDFSGLYFENDTLYVLERAAQTICKLVIGQAAMEEVDCWSYAHMENRSDLRYTDMKFGHAEGLCMDKANIFLILDNNGDSRYTDPEDKRPLLFVIERPVK